ncbi:hypothetical protein RBH29_00710 [Herbivorax sp. ANBcel31]|uniref:hypothetical protein n=1 Tax=Herbivorax sp. ANBcel31 TaxID=3069754 RepID=UPI0027B746CE|nr:hypothetical protein [Herbivorax sp. ANBcel31]MDQ2084957.1 hypothetical protein [Herbivorax sp. ANBcel31]
MSDDFNNRIKQLGDILGNENISENLINILSLLANSTKKENPPEDIQKEAPVQNNTSSKKDTPKEDFYKNAELMRKIKNVMNDANTLEDPRINLLTAIKPFLNNSRQKKVGDCIKLFQMVHVTDMMNDIEKSM